MADFWGPGLDAELAYRHERLFTALRNTPYGNTHDQRGGEHDDLLAATAHDRGTATTTASEPAAAPATAFPSATRPDGTSVPEKSGHHRMSAARGWLLRGSESWHVAR